MATIDEINHLYSSQLGGATPTAADYSYWQNSGLSGDNLYNTFTNAAKNDPRYQTTGVGNGMSFSPDSRYVAISHNLSPYVTIYDGAERPASDFYLPRVSFNGGVKAYIKAS